MSDPDGALRDEPLDLPIHDSEVVFAGRVWDVRSDTVDYHGEPIVRQYVDHPGAAVVVAVDDEERVLVIRQYRHPIRHRDWELPAGLLDAAGETPLETAQRELAEEADLDAAEWEELVALFTSPGGNSEIVHFFLARALSAREDAHAREAEEAHIEIAWTPLQAVIDGVLAGRLRNGILALGVLTAAERLRRR